MTDLEFQSVRQVPTRVVMHRQRRAISFVEKRIFGVWEDKRIEGEQYDPTKTPLTLGNNSHSHIGTRPLCAL